MIAQNISILSSLILCFASMMVACQTKSKNHFLVREQDDYQLTITRTALEQAEYPSPNWEKNQQDCAGFIRYIYKQSLQINEPLWENWDQTSTYFASAQVLASSNFKKIADEVEDFKQSSISYSKKPKTGDILVFHRKDVGQESQWHLMMLIESPVEPNRWLVTYHNGQSGSKAGVKKIWFSELENTDVLDWLPKKNNPNFLGVYRWKRWVE